MRSLLILGVLAFASEVDAPLMPVDDSDSFGIVHMLGKKLSTKPKSAESKALLGLVQTLDKKALELPPNKRQQLIEENLETLTASVRAMPVKDSDPELRRDVSLAAADLNVRAARWEDGRELAARVLAVDPNDPEALVTKSFAGSGLSDHKSAFEDADKAAKLAPQRAEPYTARALAYYGMGKYQESLEDARRALALNPSDRTAFSLLKLAEARTPAAVSDDPLRAEVQREYHGMVTQINQATKRSQEPEPRPSAPQAAKLLRSAASKLAIKDYWGCVADADRALEADPTAGAAHYYQASAYNLLGRYEEAARSASLALQLNPDDRPSRNARAWALIRLGRHSQALADANHTLELDPSNAYAYFNRAYAHEKLGDIDAMAVDLKRAMELNPQFEPVYRDAMAMHKPAPTPQPKGLASVPLKLPQGKNRSFLIVLASSTIGGLLVAAGILHIMSARKSPARSGIDHTYEIGRVIGKGGMGLVYEAVDRALQRPVAIKMLRDELARDEKARARFLEEARTVAALHHPAIVDIHSIIDADTGLYLVFERIEGRTVEEILRDKGRFTLREAKGIMKTVCQALEYAHGHGVVHRDLKPSNIMVASDGQVKVMDFGISRHAKDAPAAGVPVGTGTPYYMAPEQEYGVVRAESDVFSLGACLYEMLTGKPPFPQADAHAKLSGAYDRTGLEPAVAQVIECALTPDPDRRIKSAADFWTLLERA